MSIHDPAVAGARIVHLTTVHPRDDIRIFQKECVSLARAGYEVIQVVGDGRGDAIVNGVRIVDIGAPPIGRIARMHRQPRRAWQTVLSLRPALVHFHDPELLPVGVNLVKHGIVSVYDAHEDVPRQVLTKQWIPLPLRKPLSWVFERYENSRVRRLAAVVAATPHIGQRFAPVAPRSVVVANYPFLDELAPPSAPVSREREVCYVGGIMRTRGIFEMVRAVARVPGIRLRLAGNFEDDALQQELRAEPGWAQVDYLGQIDREQVRSVLARASAGLVTLLPMPSYLDSLPIKMFEYMSAELPVIASDFPLWRDIVERHSCGLCVNPADPEAIAGAIRAIVNAPEKLQAMGRAGRTAVLAKFNWPQAERELLALYQELLQ
jgi:glycosyltransferase involved in cell wall biosynthesis